MNILTERELKLAGVKVIKENDTSGVENDDFVGVIRAHSEMNADYYADEHGATPEQVKAIVDGVMGDSSGIKALAGELAEVVDEAFLENNKINNMFWDMLNAAAAKQGLETK